MRKKNCVYLIVLNAENSSSKLFVANCRFLGIILRYANCSNDNKMLSLLNEPMHPHSNIWTYMFDAIVKLLDDKYKKRELGI